MFQKTVHTKQALGQPGDFHDDSPSRVTAYKLDCLDGKTPAIGRVFTLDGEGKPQLGGEGPLAGILCNPNTLARLGLDASQAVPKGATGELADMGRLIVLSGGAAKPGQPVLYKTASGEIAGTGKEGSGLKALPGAKFAILEAEADGLAVIQLG